jgi:hypothetical protein
VAPVAVITGETPSPLRGFQPGLNHFQAPTLQQPPQPARDQADTPLPLKVLAEQGPSTATGSDSPATVPQPNAGRPITQGSLSRIETDYSYLLFLANSFEKLACDEIARLSGERPNDPQTIEKNRKQCDILSILADGFAGLSAALFEYSERPQPLLLDKAQQIVDEVGAQLKAWWKANAAEATDWCVRLPLLTAWIGALGLVGADMRFATPLVGALVGGQKAATLIKTVIKRRKRS